MNDLSLYSYCKLPLISPRHPVIDPSTGEKIKPLVIPPPPPPSPHTPGISPPPAFLFLNLTYYGFMKLNQKPVNAKPILISTTVWPALVLLGAIATSYLPIQVFP